MTAGRTRQSARTAMGRMRVSFFVSVALVPMLVTQVFAGIGGWLPWWAWSLLLASTVGGFFAYALHTERLRHRLERARPTAVRGVSRLDAITDLVITLDLGKGGPQNLHTLLPHLPSLRRLYALPGRRPSGPGARPRDDETTVRELVVGAGSGDVHCQVLCDLPSYDVDQATVEGLAARLSGLDAARSPGAVLAVDVTGGTSPMSLTAYLAAQRAGVPVTYTSSDPPARSGGSYRWRALIALHDPDALLTGAPIERKTT